MVTDGSEKIPISLVFSKLVLDDVKVKILLISWHFLEFPLCRPIHSLTPLFVWYIRCSGGAYLGQVSFMSQVLKFQIISYQQKVKF